MVTRQQHPSSDDIASSNPYQSAPISTRQYTTSGLISIECLVYFWIYLTFFVTPFVLSHHTQPPLPLFHLLLKGCVPHSFIHFLTHHLTSAYSFLSWTHLPLFSTDSFVPITHFDSDLLTNRSHTPYLLCFLIISLKGRGSPIWANNRIDTLFHASLLHVFK